MKLTDKELFELIMEYFPQYKDDESLSFGGYVHELPYLTLSEILFNHVLHDEIISEKDAASFSRFINDHWNADTIVPELTFIIKDSVLDHIIGKEQIISKIKLEGNALKLANQYLKASSRSSDVFFR